MTATQQPPTVDVPVASTMETPLPTTQPPTSLSTVADTMESNVPTTHPPSTSVGKQMYQLHNLSHQ